MPQQTGNVTQHSFRLIGNRLIFGNLLKLKGFGKLREKENGYEEGGEPKISRPGYPGLFYIRLISEIPGKNPNLAFD
jgi:hypothetical protein